MEENYSRGKRFGDKFWNGKTIDVLSVGFLFLCFTFVATRESCEARWLLEAQKISCGDRLGLIQWLGFNLATFLLFDLMAMIPQDLCHKETLETLISFSLFFSSLSREQLLSPPHQHIFFLVLVTTKLKFVRDLEWIRRKAWNQY